LNKREIRALSSSDGAFVFFKEECVTEISKGSKLEIRPITYEEQVGKRLIKLEDE